MGSIQIVNTLTPKQWEAVYTDNHISDAYRSVNNDQKKLEIEFGNRVRALCEKNQLPLPKRISITYDLKDCVKMMNSGELRIHPLSFVACKLNRNTMTLKQKAIYERLENYVNEQGDIGLTSSMQGLTIAEKMEAGRAGKKVDDFKPDSTKHNQAKELLDRYRAELANDIKDYQHVMPAAELDEAITSVVLMHKAYRYPTITPTMATLASLSIATLNGLSTGWIISKITSGSMYSPIAGSGALIVAGGSYVGLRLAERIGRVIAGTFFDQDMKSLALKPWKDRTLESKLFWSRLELLKGEILPKY